jgi:hypothetical protein
MSGKTISSVIHEIIERGSNNKRKSFSITHLPPQTPPRINRKKQRTTLDENDNMLQVFGKVIIHMLQQSDVSSVALVCKKLKNIVDKEVRFSTVHVKRTLETDKFVTSKKLNFLFKNYSFLAKAKELAGTRCETKTPLNDERLKINSSTIAFNVLERGVVIPNCCQKFCWMKEFIRSCTWYTFLHSISIIERRSKEDTKPVGFYADMIMECANSTANTCATDVYAITRMAIALQKIVRKETKKSKSTPSTTNIYVCLADACIRGDVPAAESLIERNTISSTCLSMFMWIACKYGRLGIAEMMIKHGFVPGSWVWYTRFLDVYIRKGFSRKPQELFDIINRNLELEAKLVKTKDTYDVYVDDTLVGVVVI